tara:strand:- start:440 stop:646 length:207 start_codon:yes stop_codon:yes gene_type:complete
MQVATTSAIRSYFDDEEWNIIVDSLHAEEMCCDDDIGRAQINALIKKIDVIIDDEYEIESIEDCSEYR